MKKERSESEYLRLRHPKVKSKGRGKKKYRNRVPMIKLKGRWLKDIGFDKGEYINITSRKGQILITLL